MKHYSTEYENLKARTKVVADIDLYHARTPKDEAWCGAEPFGKGWEVKLLNLCEQDVHLSPCSDCFQTVEVTEAQDRLEFG